MFSKFVSISYLKFHIVWGTAHDFSGFGIVKCFRGDKKITDRKNGIKIAL